MIRRPPRSPLFPSTPLSRSVLERHLPRRRERDASLRAIEEPRAQILLQLLDLEGHRRLRHEERLGRLGERQVLRRSEEHTSELQSPCNLVCRLLLEKKKQHH